MTDLIARLQAATEPSLARVKRPFWRLPLCWLGMCPHFTFDLDDNGIWSECSICHQRSGYVSREDLRRYRDREIAALKALAGKEGKW